MSNPIPVMYLTESLYQYIVGELEARGLGGVTPIMYYTPHGFLVAYLKQEVYDYSWVENGVTHYGTIPLGQRIVPVFFESYILGK